MKRGENMEKKRLYENIIAALIIVFILSLSGCLQGPIELDGVEVREYEGEDLSSIQDFRENSIKGPQYVNKSTYMLEITGEVNQEQAYRYDDVLDLFTNYKKVITLFCVEGWNVNILWEGVLVADLIETADPTAIADTVIFHAADGYTTSLPLEYIQNKSILLAYKMNNLTLPPERGFPFQLVAESKWGYKWIKWVTEIELSDNEAYRGYWERRGYANDADLNESFFGD